MDAKDSVQPVAPISTFMRSQNAMTDARKKHSARAYELCVEAEYRALDSQRSGDNYWLSYMGHKLAAINWGVEAMRSDGLPEPDWYNGLEAQLRLIAMLRPELFGPIHGETKTTPESAPDEAKP